MSPTPSRQTDGQPPQKDREREQLDAVVKDADESEQAERDAVHGDGEEIGLKKDRSPDKAG